MNGSALFEELVLCPILVGREAYVQSLQRLIARTQEGQGQTVLITGEAGIGKSRLAAEAKAMAARYGFLGLQGNCFEADRVLPYAPLLDMLHPFFGHRSADEITQILSLTDPLQARQVAPLLALFPELGALLADAESTLAPLLEPEHEKRRLWHALVQLFFRLAESRPLLILIEDVHWGDEASLNFLLYFARRAQAQPVLLLLTHRSDEAHPSLEPFVAELNRERLAAELVLPRLAHDEVEAMIRAILALEGPVGAEWLEAMYALTEGNPFFIEEVLKSLIAAGELRTTPVERPRRVFDALRIPRTVQMAVQRRTAPISHEARQLLVLAAVVGRRFDAAMLNALTGHSEDELLPLLRELLAAQLIVEEADGRFAFRHALTRETVFRDVLSIERQALHATIAGALERLYADSLDAHLADLAFHFYESGAWAKALEYAQRAGERARALYSPRAAVEQFTRALEAARRLAVTPPVRVYCARGQAYETLGDFEQARADYESALSVARANEDRRAEWQALLDLGKMWEARSYTRTGVCYRQAVELARAMNDPALLAHSLNCVGSWRVNAGKPREGKSLLQEALSIFESLSDRRGIAETFDLLGMACYLNDETPEGKTYFDQALALYEELGERRGLASCLATLAWNGFNSLKNGERAARISREIGWRSGEAYALIAAGSDAAAKGQYPRALDLLQRGLAIAEDIEHREWMAAAHCVLGRLYVDLLALDHAREHLVQALAWADEIGSSFWASIAVELLARARGMCREFAAAEAVLNASPNPSTVAYWWAGSAAGELALARGGAAAACRIADDALARDAQPDSRRANPRLFLLRGEALTALKKHAEAETSLRAALQAAHAQEAQPLVWRIHVALGKLHQSCNEAANAEREFSIARGFIAELAAALPDAALRETFQQQAHALIFGSPPARRGAKPFGGLSQRECEVAALVAQGKSNRGIAETLCVSERTVTTHITHIFDKLNFTSRTQIAAWAIERGLKQAPPNNT